MGCRDAEQTTAAAQDEAASAELAGLVRCEVCHTLAAGAWGAARQMVHAGASVPSDEWLLRLLRNSCHTQVGSHLGIASLQAWHMLPSYSLCLNVPPDRGSCALYMSSSCSWTLDVSFCLTWVLKMPSFTVLMPGTCAPPCR